MRRNFFNLLMVIFMFASRDVSSMDQTISDSPQDLPDIVTYINKSWDALSRHALGKFAVHDEKIPGTQPHVLVSRKHSLKEFAQEVKFLHEVKGHQDEPHVLYLPHRYIVPGGRFNEVYAWDTYFVVLGLLASNKLQEAKQALENALYAIDHYGLIPTANRSYYLTRSQPPFITRALKAYFTVTLDTELLSRSLPLMEKYYFYFNCDKRLIKETGLARYFDHGTNAAPEVLLGEKDKEGRSHFDRVKEYFRLQIQEGQDYHRFYDQSNDSLTDYYLLADRAMRESGFDISNRFGVFGAEVLEFNPVCLNTLLFIMETDLSYFYKKLGFFDKSRDWDDKAQSRKQKINDLLWDEQEGLYFDYHYPAKNRRNYPFLTTFWPLWAKIATPEQAAQVKSRLALFEAAGGLMTSAHKTGNQWDAPFGFAPLQLIAIEALQNYGYQEDAKRITKAFLSLIFKEYKRTGKIFEKYNVVSLSSDVGDDIKFGYPTNETGFAWTNGVFMWLYNSLSKTEREELFVKNL